MIILHFTIAGEIPAHKNERIIGRRADGSVYNGIQQDTIRRMREIKHSIAAQLPPDFKILSVRLGLIARIGTHQHNVKDADNATTTLQECLQGTVVPSAQKKGDKWVKFQSGFLIEGQSHPFTEFWIWELATDDNNPWNTAGRIIDGSLKAATADGETAGAGKHATSVGVLSKWIGSISTLVDDGRVRLGAPDDEDRRGDGDDPPDCDDGAPA